MESISRLPSQVAAMAHVDADTARTACYLADIAAAGRSLSEAASLCRKHRAEIRDYARNWGIDFSDYTYSKPERYEWVKVKRGRWELGGTDAFTVSNGAGGYVATHPAIGSEYGSSAEIACRRLSVQLERQSVDIFGFDDVAIYFDDRGCKSQVAPAFCENVAALRNALA